MQPKQQERRDSTVSDLDSRVPSCFLTLLSVDHIQPVISTTHGISVPNICFSGDITHLFTQLYSLSTCITSWQLAIYDPQPQVLNCKFSFSEKVSHITKLSIFAGIAWLYAFSLLTHSNSKTHKKLPFFLSFHIEGHIKLSNVEERHMNTRQVGLSLHFGIKFKPSKSYMRKYQMNCLPFRIMFVDGRAHYLCWNHFNTLRMRHNCHHFEDNIQMHF